MTAELTQTERWLAACANLGLHTGMDNRGLVHVLIDGTGWRSCQQAGDGHGSANLAPTAEARVCMWCRELPGRERHYRQVLGEQT